MRKKKTRAVVEQKEANSTVTTEINMRVTDAEILKQWLVYGSQTSAAVRNTAH